MIMSLIRITIVIYNNDNDNNYYCLYKDKTYRAQ